MNEDTFIFCYHLSIELSSTGHKTPAFHYQSTILLIQLLVCLGRPIEIPSILVLPEVKTDFFFPLGTLLRFTSVFLTIFLIDFLRAFSSLFDRFTLFSFIAVLNSFRSFVLSSFLALFFILNDLLIITIVISSLKFILQRLP